VRLAIGVVVYPESAPFHGALGASLRAQTDPGFTTLVLSDGDAGDLSSLTEALDTQVRPARAGAPAALRKQLIEWAGETCDALIFIDADDWCAPERVAWCRATLATHHAAAHDLELVEIDGAPLRPFIGARLADGQDIRIDDVAERNVLGLSNTAARLGPLRAAAAGAPDTVVAFDWALYTALLSTGAGLRYGATPLAAYRQHGKNIAKVTEIDAGAVRRAVSVKAEHYRLFRGLSAWYGEQGRYFQTVAEKLTTDPAFADAYLTHARQVTPANPLWWECAPSNFRITK
jgi:hypothetical protein